MLSVSLQRKYNFYHQNTLIDAFRTNSRNIGRNPSMVIPLLANQDLTPTLALVGKIGSSKDSSTSLAIFLLTGEAISIRLFFRYAGNILFEIAW